MLLKKVVAATKIIGCLMALTAFDVIADDVTLTVTNLVMRQRYPWNGLVDIDCEVICSDPATNVNLYLSAKDNVANRPLAMRRVWLENDTTHTNALEVKAGKHRLVWDAGADAPNVVSTNVAVSLQAFVGSGLYMVIDLSGGPDAVNYPVSYLGAVPQGGWSDEYKTTKLVLRRIEPGTFVMGSPTGEIGRHPYEDRHTVTLTKPFYIGVFELTQSQWQLVMGSNPSVYSGSMRPVENVSYVMVRGSSLGSGWPASSSVDQSSFIGRLREKSGCEMFDVPTEAQWEYACRAGTTTALNNGLNLNNSDTDDNMSKVGRYAGTLGDGKGGYSQYHTTVGSYLPNEWGLYDMHGNVWEWCLDWWGTRLSDAVDPYGPVSGRKRVFRGGSSDNPAFVCRSAYRDFDYISNTDSNSKGFRIGLRVCCHTELPQMALIVKSAVRAVRASKKSEGIEIDANSEAGAPVKSK